jgi:hypothetical protein
VHSVLVLQSSNIDFTLVRVAIPVSRSVWPWHEAPQAIVIENQETTFWFSYEL